MSWADNYIARLKKGETIQFRPRGQSMAGRINSGALVTVAPVLDITPVFVGSVVLAKVKGRVYLHLVGATSGCDGDEDVYRIENMRGYVNGWTGAFQDLWYRDQG